jgi:SAM-dependent methyltransferase
MIDRIFAEFQRLIRRLEERPRAVLEVGAVPSSDCLLTCPELRNVPTRIGINLRSLGSYEGISVLAMDARCMAFADHSFDLVLCASTLEHIPEFWLACAEMHRVLVPGGRLVVSTPGFVETRFGNAVRWLASNLPLPDLIKRGTPTMRIHDAPHDYYRFSPHAYRDVILQGLDDVRVWSVMQPPRVFGMGRKRCG